MGSSTERHLILPRLQALNASIVKESPYPPNKCRATQRFVQAAATRGIKKAPEGAYFNFTCIDHVSIGCRHPTTAD
jgi:hypothetical protein